MKIKISTFVKYFIILGLLIVPLLHIGEVNALMSGELESQSTLYTPIYIKVLKDLIMISLLFILLLLYIRETKLSYFIVLLALILIINISIFFSSLAGNTETLIFGLRWIYPLFIFLLGLNFIKRDLLDISFEYVLIFIFLIHFFMQVYLFFSEISWFGLILDKYSGRNPGIFLLPNNAAFFSVLILFWLLFFSKIKANIIKLFLILLTVVSIFLTASGTGLVTLVFILTIYGLPKVFLIFAPLIGLFSMPILILIFNLVRGKEYIEVSGGTRLQIFVDNFVDSSLFSKSFGYFTNVATLMNYSDKIMDSTYASLVGNLGILPFMIILIILFLALVKAFTKFDKVKINFLIIILFFSSTTIIFEAYPMNLLLAIWGCILYGQKQQSQHSLPNL